MSEKVMNFGLGFFMATASIAMIALTYKIIAGAALCN